MSENIPTTQFQCTQCGGELHPDQGQLFLVCPFCSSSVYLDKTKVVFHWYINPTLDETKASGALARWMSGNDTIKDLDKKSKITGVEFQYFPLWYFKTKDAKGKEKVRLEPAAATTVTEITRLNLPAGDLVQYDHRIDADAHAPSVPLNAALGWAEQNAKDFKQSEVIETSLVHIPIYIFKYVLEGKNYTALVDGSSSVVFANIFPAKAETPYQLVGGLAAVTYLVLAIFPVVGAMFGDGGFGIGFAIFCVVGLPAGIGLMALAAWVSQKV